MNLRRGNSMSNWWPISEVCHIIIIIIWSYLSIFWYVLVFVYLFWAESSKIDSRKTSITQELLVVECCPAPRWIALLMVYKLVYNTRSYLIELVLALSAHERQAARRAKPHFSQTLSHSDHRLVEKVFLDLSVMTATSSETLFKFSCSDHNLLMVTCCA